MDELLIQSFGGDNAIETDRLHKRFDGSMALDGVSINVPKGAVYLLVGPNGAGKTTLLRILLEQLRPTAGTAQVLGRESHRHGAWVRAATGYVPESGMPPYPSMRVDELLHYHARYYSTWDATYAEKLVEVLAVRRHTRLGAVSKGEGRRVQIVMALAHRPPVLLLDEPTDGLDPVVRDRFFSLLAEHLAENETTVLVSSHLVYESELLASHLGVLGTGTLRAQLDRGALDANLRRYTGRGALNQTLTGTTPSRLLQTREFGGGTEWIVWGDEEDVRARLQANGADIRDVRRLTLEETARVLMSREEETV